MAKTDLEIILDYYSEMNEVFKAYDFRTNRYLVRTTLKKRQTCLEFVYLQYFTPYQLCAVTSKVTGNDILTIPPREKAMTIITEATKQKYNRKIVSINELRRKK